MIESSNSWSLIESSPGVFTELIRDFGCQGVQAEAVLNIDTEIFQNLEPIHGLILLFKWVQLDVPAGTLVDDDRLDTIFFAQQVDNNACATQAILSVLLNCNHDDIKLGTTLTEFKEFTQSFDPHNKGLTLSNAPNLRSVHNSFARQTLSELDTKNQEKDDDELHYIAYVPINGRLYELDGLKDGPLDLGPVGPDQNWTDVVRPFIDRRIRMYGEGKIYFNLMAIVSDRLKIYQDQIDKLLNLEDDAMMEDDKQIEIGKLHSLIELEMEKRKRYKIENIRRKHNYLPFIMELLKMLAAKKQLMPIYEQAKQHAIEQQKAAKNAAGAAADAKAGTSKKKS